MDTFSQKMSTREPVRLLALGDSYTIGESVAEVQRWPVQLIDSLKKEGYTCYPPEVIARTGWRTDELQKAIKIGDPDRNFTLVALLIGVNNQFQGKSLPEYESQFQELLNTALEHAGGNAEKVLVLSIPDYGFTPFGRENQQRISREIDAFNFVNKSLAEKKGVTYINITDISRRASDDPELVAEDGLHPSGKMYALWVQRILEALKQF